MTTILTDNIAREHAKRGMNLLRNIADQEERGIDSDDTREHAARCFRHAADYLAGDQAAHAERLAKALEIIAACEPVDGKAAKNRGNMLRMQAIARAALDEYRSNGG